MTKELKIKIKPLTRRRICGGKKANAMLKSSFAAIWALLESLQGIWLKEAHILLCSLCMGSNVKLCTGWWAAEFSEKITITMLSYVLDWGWVACSARRGRSNTKDIKNESFTKLSCFHNGVNIYEEKKYSFDVWQIHISIVYKSD